MVGFWGTKPEKNSEKHKTKDEQPVVTEELTKEECLETIRNGFQVGQLPGQFQTEEFFLEAVEKGVFDSCSFSDIPSCCRTEDVCMKYLQRSNSRGDRVDSLFADFPEDSRSEALYLEGAKRGLSFKEVPEDHRSLAVCMAVCLNKAKNYGTFPYTGSYSLDNVPEEHREAVRAAVIKHYAQKSEQREGDEKTSPAGKRTEEVVEEKAAHENNIKPSL